MGGNGDWGATCPRSDLVRASEAALTSPVPTYVFSNDAISSNNAKLNCTGTSKLSDLGFAENVSLCLYVVMSLCLERLNFFFLEGGAKNVSGNIYLATSYILIRYKVIT